MDEERKFKLLAEAEMEAHYATEEYQISLAVDRALETLRKDFAGRVAEDLFNWKAVEEWLLDYAVALIVTDSDVLLDAFQAELIVGGWQ